ncbi:Uncharacterised protein [Salmonella enterica subsp. arizonae]|uniref:Uncharacterized protein n=1 Tax=Salmonella enterica subsp. arizonae TaxID=59203 RepID=A0A379SUU9_SALER|nr:Uncharacterised protein [Salmonella enterica subsp. arizonae]
MTVVVGFLALQQHNQLTVAIGIHLRWKQRCPRFVSAKIHIHDRLFRNVQRKRGFQTQDATVMKLNGAKQRIFDGVSCRIPFPKLSVVLARANFSENCAR